MRRSDAPLGWGSPYSGTAVKNPGTLMTLECKRLSKHTVDRSTGHSCLLPMVRKKSPHSQIRQ